MKSLLSIARRGARAIYDQVRVRSFDLTRKRLSRRYLRGRGIEVGALHRPLWVSRAATVQYVDRMDVDALRAQYPELADHDLVPVDLVDDGETLALQPDESADFIIANHFFEHTEDPLGTLRAHLRVLRRDGILYLAVPDRRKTFDADRDPTPIEHVARDHREGPAWSRPGHHEEWARLVDRVPDDQVAQHVARLEATNYSIHFHVWSPDEFAELLDHAREQEGMPFVVERLQSNQDEFISILRKR